MKIFNQTGSYYIAIKNDLPKITDSIEVDDDGTITRTTECDPFEAVNPMNKNDTIKIEHQGVTLFTGTTERTEKNYKVLSISAVRTIPMTIENPMIVSNSYDYDGETQTFELAIPHFENEVMPLANDTIIFDGKNSNQNKLTYDFNAGTIAVERNV